MKNGEIMKTMIARNLDILIKRAGINPYTLHEKTKVPQPTIHRILKGESADPRTNTVKPLAKFFGITVEELRERDLTAEASAPEKTQYIAKTSEEKALLKLFRNLTEDQQKQVLESLEQTTQQNLELWQQLSKIMKPKK